MGNHESFLKMIGMSAEAETPAEKPVEEKKEDSWGTFDLQEQSQPTNSETEWEISAAAEVVDTKTLESPSDPAAEAAEPAEPAQNESSWEESASESGELNAEFKEGFTRTERYDGDEPIQTESTAVYTADEIERVSGEQIRGLTLTGADKTRPTVPFNYDKSRISRASLIEGSEGKTAHFDYSRQQADYRIVVLEGKVSAQAFHLGHLPLRIGRDPQNEVALDDVNASRFHAEIRDLNGKIGIFDLGSTNGVKVNGKLVTESELRCHDIVQVGDCLFEFLDPGVLSKGAPVAAIAGEASGIVHTRPKSRKRIYLYAALGILGAGLWLGARMLQDPSIRDAVQQEALEIAASAAQKEIEALRSMMETTYGVSIERIDSQEVKKAFIERFEAKGLLNFASDAKAQIEALPSQVIHLLVIHPDIFGQAIAAGGSSEAIAAVLRNKINALIEAQNFEQALQVTEVLLAISSDDPQVKEAYEKLKTIVARAKSKDQGGASENNFTPAEQKFFGYMEEHENFVLRLIDENKLADAIRYSEIVVEKLGELIKQDAQYERVAKDEIARWNDRLDKLNEKSQEKKEKQKKDDTSLLAGDELLDRIQEAFDSGNMAEAQKLTKTFQIEYPKHPRIAEVKGINSQIAQMVERSFEATKASVESLMEQEGYENAWKELYRFFEIMPEYQPALELQAALDKRASPKAAQFYNQARVFEFEADDLVAAEQYYKKTMEFADPESDLFKKAKRRFDDVKRKGIR